MIMLSCILYRTCVASPLTLFYHILVLNIHIGLSSFVHFFEDRAQWQSQSSRPAEGVSRLPAEPTLTFQLLKQRSIEALHDDNQMAYYTAAALVIGHQRATYSQIDEENADMVNC